jgi:adenylate cyclase
LVEKGSMTPGGSTQYAVQQLPRQWRAIVFADLVESVRLMQEHGFALVDRWRAFVQETRQLLLPTQSGRLVRTAGDGLLIECPSAVQAIAVSFALHEAIQRHSEGLNEDQTMRLRVGVHCGEVVFDEQEAYGADVNLAARLAGAARPGETLISAAVRLPLADGLHARLEDLGERYLKHIDQAQQVFLAQPPGVGSSLATRQSSRLPVQDLRPIVAVLPFQALPMSPEGEALGHALADELISALARHPGLRVLSRTSTALVSVADRDGAQLPQLQRALNASFLVTGRLYQQGDRVRASIEMAGLPNGVVHWADQLVTSVSALFDGSDQLVPQVATRIGEQVQAHELLRVRNLPMDALAPYTLFVGASGLLNSLSPQDFDRAREAFEHLMDRNPRQSAPAAMMARWHVFRIAQGWSSDVGKDQEQARRYAERAIDLDPDQAVAHAALGLVSMNASFDLRAAEEHNDWAIGAEPHEPHAYSQQAAVLSHLGRHEDAVAAAERAIALSPLDPGRFLFESYAALAHAAAGDAERALQLARSSLRRNHRHAPSHRLQISLLWQLGRQAEAKSAVQIFQRCCPRAGNPPRADAADLAPWYAALVSALREAMNQS